jgi:thymidylate synthase
MTTKLFYSVDVAFHAICTEILENGVVVPTRTGTNCIQAQLPISYSLDISERFPLLSLRPIPFRSVVAEILWYLTGDPHVKFLHDAGVRFWDSWTDERGTLQSAYGRFWRNYPVDLYPYEGEAREPQTTMFGMGFDQISAIVRELEANPTSRRLHLSAWYAPNAWNSKLPPCHHSFTLSVVDGRLNGHLMMRSNDIPVGFPFNVAGYSLLIHLFARRAGLRVGYFTHTITNAHIYEDQVKPLNLLLKARATERPTLVISGDEDYLTSRPRVEWIDHFSVDNYHPLPFTGKFPVAV